MPNYIVVTNQGVLIEKSIRKINDKLKAVMQEVEFRKIGNDYIINLTNENIDFIQDRKRMSQIPIKNLYKKNNLVPILLGIIAFLQIILLTKG